ncbi:MAG: GPR endopeptidase, partial [Clostridia bacterium]|nr:GPR endopeptidase [Clostridia bacterium]
MKKTINFYSDLADERISASNSKIMGEQTYSGKYGLKKFEFTVKKEDEKVLGKSAGNYVTINCSKLLAHLTRVQDYVAKEVAYALRKFILSTTNKKNPFVLVVGLGNGGMVADSLGVKVAENLLITHGMPEFAREELGDLSAIIPGVGGCTGIATYDIIAGVCEKVKPDVVIAIDTLT